MESKTILMYFSYSIRLKFVCLSHWMTLLPNHGFVRPWLVTWKMLACWAIHIFTMASPFYNAPPKNHILIFLIRKVFQIWGSCQEHRRQNTHFPRIIFIRKLTCCHWQQILFSLEWHFKKCSFSRKYLPDTQVWVMIACQSFFWVKTVFYGKSGLFTFDSANLTSAFLESTVILQCPANVPHVCLILLHRMLKCVLHLRFNTNSWFASWLNTFVNGTNAVPYCWVCGGEELVQFVPRWGTRSFPHCYICTITVKKIDKEPLSVIMKVVWTSLTFQKGLGISRSSTEMGCYSLCVVLPLMSFRSV